MHQSNIDILKYAKILIHGKWILIICVILALLPVIYYNQIAKPVYQSSTTIIFDRQTEQLSIGNSFPFQQGKSFIANQIGEIKSKSLAEDVTLELSDSVIRQFPITKELPSNFNKFNYISTLIFKNISARSIKNSDMIQITIKAPTPKLASIIGNTITQVLEKRSLIIKREETNNAIKMIGEQLTRYRTKLDNAEIALKNYKQLNKITISPDQESIQIFQRITNAEVLFNETKSNRESAESRLQFIKKKIKEERQGLVPNITKVSSPWIQKLKENLVDLEVQYTNLKVQNYSPNHPQMIQLKDKIDQTKKNLTTETMKLAQGENIIDPIHQIKKFLEESISLEVEIQTYKAQEAALQRVIDDYNYSLKSVPDKELELARLIRNKNVNEQIYVMLLQKYEEMKIIEAQKIGNIRIIDPARIPNSPISPRKRLNLILGIFLGLSFGLSVLIFREYMDNSIKSVNELENLTNISVLATVPYIRTKSLRKKNKNMKYPLYNERLITALDPKSPFAEVFYTLRTNIQFSSIDNTLKKIVITSSNPNEGKSLISANLGISTAQIGLKTLLIDLDLRKPNLHTLFGLKKEPGLVNGIVSLKSVIKDTNASQFRTVHLKENMATGEIPELEFPARGNWTKETYSKNIDEILNQYIFESTENIIQKTGIPNLDILTSGHIPPNPSFIFSSTIFHQIIDVLSANYDMIILDTPPILAVTDALLISPVSDGVILVTKAEKTKSSEVQSTLTLLKRAKGNILGFVFNQAEKPKNLNYKYYYYYGNNGHSTYNKQKKRFLFIKS